MRRYPDGKGYIGQWCDGWRHGQGVLYFGVGEQIVGKGRHGRRWEGSFEQDKAHGIGTMYIASTAPTSTDSSDSTELTVPAEFKHGELMEQFD